MASKTMIAHIADFKGQMLCSLIGHRPILAEVVRRDPATWTEQRDRGVYCRRCWRHVGD